MKINCLRHALKPQKTSFDSYYQRLSTLIWGAIKVHIDANNMLEKPIKDHPIAVGYYAQWIVSKSGRKEAMDSKIMATKLKYKVNELPSS